MDCNGKRRARSTVEWRKRRSIIADAALPIFGERHWSGLSVEDIAEKTGNSYWKIYYSFDGLEDLYRTCIARLVDRVADTIVDAPENCASVNRTIHIYVRYAAEIVRSEAYGRLLFFRLRDGHAESWVRTSYEREIADPLRRGLEHAVVSAGEQFGIEMIMLHGAQDRYLMMLEAALAMPKLLNRDDYVDEVFERTVATVAKDMVAATCTFDGFDQAAIAAA